jgi:anti-sigma B factor antagonist
VELSLTTRTLGDHTVLAVGGEIDVYTAPQLRTELIRLADQGQVRIVVDLQGVEFLDSTGLGVLVGALKRARVGGGSVELACNQPKILKIFNVTGLEKVFAIHPSVDEAVAAG